MKIDTETKITYRLTLSEDELFALGVAAYCFPDDRRQLAAGTGHRPLLPKFDRLLQTLGGEIRKSLEAEPVPRFISEAWGETQG